MKRSDFQAMAHRDLKAANDYIDDLTKQWRNFLKRSSEIAKLHMPTFRHGSTHPIDLPGTLLGNSSPQAKVMLWCKECNKPWPCKTYQVACDCPPFTVEFEKEEPHL